MCDDHAEQTLETALRLLRFARELEPGDEIVAEALDDAIMETLVALRRTDAALDERRSRIRADGGNSTSPSESPERS